MKPIKRAIIACWVMLVACFAIKLFGGNWFEVVCTNEHFLKICEFIEGNKFAYVPLSLFVYLIPTVFILLSVCRKPKPNKSQLILIASSLFVCWAISYISDTAKYFMEIIVISILPTLVPLLDKERKPLREIAKHWYRGILANAIILVFQLLSLITRNIGLKSLNDNLVITYITLIDYYIMAFLFYLNSLSKEK